MRKLLITTFAIATTLTTTYASAEINITADQTRWSESDCTTQYSGNVKLRVDRVKEITSKHSERTDETKIRFTDDVKIHLENAVITTEAATYTALDKHVLITMKSATVSNTYSCKNKKQAK
ncbi:hypothetical protein H0A36_15470 [Endozoicomonas sp. SM1973]|uniref:Organic solvent tolerance-like N-terminal domain-containing protein n=1 Tax=Spartinivicinus marinus TaxID=2994442 RepID=A0A853IIH4_9GAMM|nr:hypothetical protein [Spartinivicinus marinus]MCX4028470.1 hypothetical protein [Spartinivicinus marinus]NYZ67416.1 hypothetical protein [Spartinivicinus marinus]